MSLISTDELKTLIEHSQSPCVSIYMPTVKAGAETQQNPIRFKNLIKQAEDQLEGDEFRRTDASDFLQPALDLDRDDFWQNQDEGLAIFVAEGFFRYYCAPALFDEKVVVNDRFHLKPLIPFITGGDEKFYILALSQKKVRFFEATRTSIKEVAVEGMPESLDAALQYDETAKAGQFRINTSKGGTNNSFQQAGSFHGQGSPDRDQHQKDILQFFYVVDKALHEVLRNKRTPMVLATVEYEVPLYQEANTYQHLLAESISTENVQIVDPEELLQRALPLVEPHFTKAEDDAIEYFGEALGAGRTSTDIQEVIPATFYGRVEQLLVAINEQRWGNFDSQANQLKMHTEAEPGDEDLIDAAAIQTLLNGGTVYAIAPDRIPDESPVAAVLRY
jgi:hypothetical protein